MKVTPLKPKWLIKNQFCSKSQVVVLVELLLPCLFLQSLVGNYDIIVQLIGFKIQDCMNLDIKVVLIICIISYSR